ncbi:MAG TPA: YncE family protein [Thermoanaerobaculia bacterium]|nr:YncE family protein [Thermoanaerobaculia bacterium]
MSFRNRLLALVLMPALLASAGSPSSQQVERDGVIVELLSTTPVANEEVDLRFAVRSADGTRISGIRPAAWIDARDQSGACKDKIQSFLGGTLRARPVVDLNTWHVVTLNAEASVSVIDPLLGFGGSKLLTAVSLLSPGVDWVLSRDQRRLFVSMPLVNRIAVIDTGAWQVVQNIETAFRPARLALDEQQRLWVAHENDRPGDPALTIIDTESLAVVAAIATGRAPHHLAFTPDGTRVLVTNSRDGTVSIVDVAKRAKIADVATGPAPAGIAASPLSAAVYVIDREDGSISVLDAGASAVSRRIAAKPGLNAIQFAPGGRWGFVTNGKENVVHVLDSATAAIVTTATDVGIEPDQVSFTADFAYVRAAGSDQVKMIRLAALGKDKEANIATFPAGQIPPGAAQTVSFASAIVPAPEPKAVLVANPADRVVYYYMEGMAAPMGNFRAARHSPKAALVIDRSLRESEPGVFSIRTKVPAAGQYDVAFFLNAPRVVHCFDLAVKPDPNAARTLARREIAIEPILDKKPIVAGRDLEVRFRLSDSATKELQRDLRDVRALAFRAPGTSQRRVAAEPLDDGTYKIKLPVPDPGIYYVFLESDSLQLKVNAARPLIFEALER